MSVAAEIVINAAHNERAPKACRLRYDTIARQPKRALDSTVQPTLRFMLRYLPGNRYSQETTTVFRLLPEINTNQCLWSKMPSALFKRFANHRLDQALTIFEMSGRLIQY